MVVDGSSCCVILECLVTSIALHHVTSITPNKMADNMSFCQRAVIKFLVKEEIPAAEIHQRFQLAYGSVYMGASSVRRWAKHFKDGTRASKMSLGAVVLEQPPLNATRREWMRSFKMTGV